MLRRRGLQGPQRAAEVQGWGAVQYSAPFSECSQLRLTSPWFARIRWMGTSHVALAELGACIPTARHLAG